jgi:hypothetical protein
MSNTKGGTMFKLIALVAAVGLLAVVAGAGQARAAGNPCVAPTGTCTGSFSFVDPPQVIEPESSICGFDITLVQSGTGYFTYVVDAANGYIHGTVHLNITGTVSANGKALQVMSADNLLFSPQPGEKEAGLPFKMFLPGLGVVLWGRGLLVFDANGNIVFDAGSHPEPEGDVATMERLCVALAP